MRLVNLQLSGFMPFGGSFSIDFPPSGIVLIRGRHRNSKSQSSNGVGKSSIIDAIAWCLFGRTCRGLRGADVISKYGDGTCRVAVTIDLGDRSLFMERRRPGSHTHLVCGNDSFSNEDANVAVSDILGFGYREFVYALFYSPSVGHRFVELSSEEKLKILDGIVGIDFDSRFAAIKTRLSTVQDKVDSLDSYLRNAKLKLQSASSDLDDFLRQSRSIDEYKAEIVQLESRKKQINEEIVEVDQKITGLESYERRASELRQSIGQLERSYGSAMARIPEYVVMRGDNSWVCKYCGSGIVDEVTLDSVREVRSIVAAAKQQRDDLNSELRAVMAMISDLNVNIEKKKRLYAEYNAVSARIRELEYRVESHNSRLTALRARVSEAQAEIDRLLAEKGPLQDELNKLQYLSSAYSIRGMRAIAFARVSDIINSALDSSLAFLSNGEIVARFVIDPEKRTPVILEANRVDNGVGLGGLSSGERRRIDFAISEALRVLATMSTKRGFPIEVYDEPTDSLDEIGREMFCEMVRARSAKCPIVVITHSAELSSFLQPDMVIDLERFENGTVISVS
ncbi:MAG: AAA family ATPase [Candidatus Bilamarchaeaceae archaeon]